MSTLRRVLQGDPAAVARSDVDLAELAVLFDTPQTKAFHAEGNVGIHTRMVLEQTEQLLADNAGLADLSGGFGAAVLRLAALFHDIGKPACTEQVEEEVWSAHGHAEVGAQTVAELMQSEPLLLRLPLGVRWAVHTLVRNHMWTYGIDDISFGAMVRSAHLADPRLLQTLFAADSRGRICEDPDEVAERVRWAQLVMDDADITVNCYPHTAVTQVEPASLTPRVRRALLRAVVAGQVTNAGAAAAYVADRQRAAGDVTLTWMFGLPGSGKSTWARREADRTGALRLAAEGRRARDRKAEHGRIRQQVPEFLHEGQDIIIDATHITRDSRDRWLTMAEQYGADVRAVYLHTSLPAALRRQKTRKPQDAVPADVIRQMARRMRWPSPDEYSQLLIVEPDGTEWSYTPTSRFADRYDAPTVDAVTPTSSTNDSNDNSTT